MNANKYSSVSVKPINISDIKTYTTKMNIKIDDISKTKKSIANFVKYGAKNDINAMSLFITLINQHNKDHNFIYPDNIDEFIIDDELIKLLIESIDDRISNYGKIYDGKDDLKLFCDTLIYEKFLIGGISEQDTESKLLFDKIMLDKDVKLKSSFSILRLIFLIFNFLLNIVPNIVKFIVSIILWIFVPKKKNKNILI